MYTILPKLNSLNVGFQRVSTSTSHSFFTSSALKKKTFEELVGIQPKPKRPLSAYFKFAAELRPALVKANPAMSVTQIAKLTAEKWKEVDEDSKKKYVDEYLQDKKKYDVAVSAYSSELSKVDPNEVAAYADLLKKEKRELSKRKADFGQPKKPMSQYLMFLQDKRPERGADEPYKDWVAKVTEEWKSLSESDKQSYATRYEKSKEEHEKEMTQWAKRMCETGNRHVVPKKLVSSVSRPSTK